MLRKRIDKAEFIDKAHIKIETTYAVDAGTLFVLYDGAVAVAHAAATESGKTLTVEFGIVFDFSADYFIGSAAFEDRAAVHKHLLLDDPEFIRLFENDEVQRLEYGAIVDEERGRTTFRLWAPLASAVSVNIYADGVGRRLKRVQMSERKIGMRKTGVWELTLEANLYGRYYTYTVTNYGVATETVDPYARSCGANGVRGMIVDLKAASPEGWERDARLYESDPRAADTPIVWEAHVRDFSISPDSGMRFKGKYLAFTESGTVVPGKPELKTGVDYLKALGVTYVQLNPVFDYATIDESDMSVADDTKDAFNWGYDPQNYNIPEGSYATDGTRGEVRVREFKQMVAALHRAGIGVIMDVVYNHTYQTHGQALHDTVPFYYHRTDAKGEFTDGAGCGNETASERTMCRKYIVDSVVYWAKEYHIDGFRFDLMGIHDKLTLRAIRNALDALDGGNGRKILMYGEPWAGFGYKTPESYVRRVAATNGKGFGKYTDNTDNALTVQLYFDDRLNELPTRVGVFNDGGRDGLRGNLWDGEPGRGWASGNYADTGNVQRMIEGGAGMFGGGKNLGTGSRNVAYASAHDNYTLWDQLAGKKHGAETPMFYDYADEARMKMCMLVHAAYLMSCGVPFMLAGEEMCRTKYGNENSYKSPPKLNRIEWGRQKAFAPVLNNVKALIWTRRKWSDRLFSYEKSTSPDFAWGDFSGSDAARGRIVFNRGADIKLSLFLDPETLSAEVKINGETIVKV